MKKPLVSQNLPHSKNGETALNIAIKTAKEAGELLKDSFSKKRTVDFKGKGNVVTDADYLAEKHIIKSLIKEFPDFGIVSEESPPIEKDSDYKWMIDPLDGTRNYASGIPHFCTVISLYYKNSVVLGVTYDPIRKELFWASKNNGSFLNGEKIVVSVKKDLLQSVMGMDLGYIDKKAVTAFGLLGILFENIQGVRLLGSAALSLAYVACGRLELYAHHHLYPWDISSGIILVEEAGGIVKNKNGKALTSTDPSILASSNKTIMKEFLDISKNSKWDHL